MLLQVIVQCFSSSLVYSTDHLTISQFGFCLPLELRFGHLYRQHGCKPFTKVITADFHLYLFQHLGILGIFLQCARKPSPEAGKVCTSFDGIDVIYVREYVFVVRGIVRHRYFDGNALFFGNDMNGFRNERLLGLVDITNKLFQPIFRIKTFCFESTVFAGRSLVGKGKRYPGIQKSQFTKSCRQNIIAVF
ncbi:hypothetical protein SDC9_130244 [bioreactor metagenome]|uniref:Uncharacterized protein n=1 Tax=bioreactor metagenome TaxID=1076179 RepID=A0A645D1Y1_9ZZZZ